MKAVNKDRIQNNIADCADDYGHHTGFSISLCRNKGIHTKSQLYKNRTHSIDVHICRSIGNRVFTGTKSHQKAFIENKQYHCEDHRKDHLQGKTPSQDLLRRIQILLSHKDRCPRCAAGAYQRRKGRHDHDDRHTHTHSRQRQTAVPGHMSDINTIHDIVEHVDHLCHYSGNRKFKQKPSHRLRSQKFLILFHKMSSP